MFEALFLSLYLAVIILWVRFVADDDRVRVLGWEVNDLGALSVPFPPASNADVDPGLVCHDIVALCVYRCCVQNTFTVNATSFEELTPLLSKYAGAYTVAGLIGFMSALKIFKYVLAS